MGDTAVLENAKAILVNGDGDKLELSLQKWEEKAVKAQEAFEREEKARKELEALNSKLLSEKTDLLRQLEGEKGSLSEYQEKAIKLAAQKTDLESQIAVSLIKKKKRKEKKTIIDQIFTIF